MNGTEKMHLYVTLIPLKLKIAVAHYPEETIGDIQFFLEETMKKFRVKNYRIGRIEKKSNNAVILPQFKIKEFLTENEEIVAFPVDYGFTKTANDKSISTNLIDEINNGFISKKTKRKNNEDDQKSIYNSYPNNFKQNKQSKPNTKVEKQEESKEDNSEDDNNEKSEENEQKNMSQEEEEEESNEDKSEDIIVTSNKKKKYN